MFVVVFEHHLKLFIEYKFLRAGGFLQVWDYKEGRLLSTVDRSSLSYFPHNGKVVLMNNIIF